MIKLEKLSIHLALIVLLFLQCQYSVESHGTLQVVHFLDPSDPETVYYQTWNSDQWINWLREKYKREAEAVRQQAFEENSSNGDTQPELPIQGLRGSYVNIIIPVTQEDFKTAYSSDSMQTYPDDPGRSDFFWSDFAFPAFVIIRSPNATMDITEEDEVDEDTVTSNSNENVDEPPEPRKRTIYGYNVFNCQEKKFFVSAKIDPETNDPILFQTFFPKRVKNPKDKLRLPLSVCTKVSQARNLLDEIAFQLRAVNV